MFCRGCGKETPEDAAFCSHCGLQQSGPTREPTPEPETKPEKKDNTAGIVLVVILAIAFFVWLVASQLDSGEETYHVTGQIKSTVEIRPLP